MTKLSLRILVAACAAFLLSAPIHAEIDGSIWENVDADATPGNVPHTAPDVTFSLPGTSIDFESPIGGYTIGGFLTGSPTPATITSGAGEAGNTLNNTIFDITGTVTVVNGQPFEAGHDDGMTLIIGGVTVIDAPGPTSFNVTDGNYTGPDGTFPFELVYSEVMGAPADLEISGFDLVSAAPEPSSVVLMSTVLLGLGFMLRKRFAKSV